MAATTSRRTEFSFQLPSGLCETASGKSMPSGNARTQSNEVGYMAWEWVAPVGTSVVGFAGITTTYLMGRLQVVTQRNIVDRTSDRQLDREEVARKYDAASDFMGRVEEGLVVVHFYRQIWSRAADAYRQRSGKDPAYRLSDDEVRAEIFPALELGQLPTILSPKTVEYGELAKAHEKVKLLFDTTVSQKAERVFFTYTEMLTKSTSATEQSEFEALRARMQEFRSAVAVVLASRAGR